MIKSISNTYTHQLGSISSTCDLIDAKLEEHQLAGGSNLQCPCCGHKLERKPDWVGLPAGVKFDPTDQELIEHLEAKVVLANIESKSHPLIDEFIPTIEGEDGICYTHPEKLPGVTRDGLNRHFFHRPSKAYTTGTRKRRKIQTECDDLQGGETRWHKTGKTRPVIVNGKQKGCKKILVLYKNFGKNRKPEKTNWVMHQYHLGHHEEETEGELVVSKIFYQTQPRQCSSKEINIPCHGDELSVAAVCGAMSSYSTMDIQQLKADNFGFLPFEKSSEAGIIVADDTISTTALHISRPSSSISAIMDQPTLHHTSVILEKDSFHVPGIILPHEHFQKQQQQYQQQQHQLEERSASGLEELIMGCTSTDREESSISNPQEADWLKYSPFWHDPDNSDHHR